MQSRLFITVLLFYQFLLFGLSYADPVPFLSPLPCKGGEIADYSVSFLGVTIGNQIFYFDGLTNLNGTNVLTGRASLETTPFISSLYLIKDTEQSFFEPDTMTPLFYERWVNEGKWHDNMKYHFYPDQHKVEIQQKVNNYRTDTQTYNNILMNYFTLIMYLRSIDWDIVSKNKQKVVLNYLFNYGMNEAEFVPSFTKFWYKGKQYDAIIIKETGGIGINLKLLKDENRMPVEVTIQKYQIIGYQTVSVFAKLEKYTPGKAE